MEVVRAKTAGFCMGVALALRKLDTALENATEQCERICTYGPIIHNPQVLESYAAQGVCSISKIDEVLENDCVIIRAHGITLQEEDALNTSGARLVDATCPKVKKAQLAIAKATQNNATLLLFGEIDHPEVRGLVSYAKAQAFIFDSLQELQALELAPQGSYVLASQTTQDKQVFAQIEAYLLQTINDINILSTICNATSERQAEAMSIASQVQAMVIVGGKDSGNTRRLYDVAAAQGIPTWHVETVFELKKENFNKICTVGLTAGASTPKSLIDAVHDFLDATS